MSNNKHILTREGRWITVSDDELCHAAHKYIKRERVNGRYRYWYKKAESEAYAARDNMNQAESEHAEAEKRLQDAIDAANEIWAKPDSEFDRSEYDAAMAVAYAEAEKEWETANAYANAKAEFEKAMSNYNEAKDKYEKYLDEDAATFVSNSSDKIDRASTYVRDLFSKKPQIK